MAVGLGATLLLHCDLVVIDENALVRMPFVALGTCAEASSSWLLPKRVGPQEAMWMVLSGRVFTADEVVANGFALAKAPAGEAHAEAMEMAEQLAGPRDRRAGRQQGTVARGMGPADHRGLGP